MYLPSVVCCLFPFSDIRVKPGSRDRGNCLQKALKELSSERSLYGIWDYPPLFAHYIHAHSFKIIKGGLLGQA
jgi:hypothetical protein